MNISSSTTDAVSILLHSLQNICRNLSHLLNALDEDVDSFERLLARIKSSIDESSSSSNLDEENNGQNIENNEDFYEKLCDEQLEPRQIRVTTL